MRGETTARSRATAPSISSGDRQARARTGAAADPSTARAASVTGSTTPQRVADAGGTGAGSRRRSRRPAPAVGDLPRGDARRRSPARRRPPSATSPPTQTASARRAAYRSASIRVIIIDGPRPPPRAAARGRCPTMPTFTWLPWSATPFARARAERKPVLLSIVTGVVAGLPRDGRHDLRRSRRSSPSSTTRFVPVRVDADRRPDISERYSLGGWPTTAFLTPRRRDRRRRHVRRAGSDRRRCWRGWPRRSRRGPATLTRAQCAACDPDARRRGAVDCRTTSCCRRRVRDVRRGHGGFGGAPKFPLVAPVQLALELHRDDGDRRRAQIADRHARRDGLGRALRRRRRRLLPLRATRDWQRAAPREAARRQRALLDLYLDAGATSGRRSATPNGADALRYVQTWLADPVDGGWGGSQQADRDYYDAPVDRRRADASAAGRSHAVLRGWNATMVSAALHAAHARSTTTRSARLRAEVARARAVDLLPARAGVAHYVDAATPRSAACSTISSRWRPPASMPTTPPATSSTR